MVPGLRLIAGGHRWTPAVTGQGAAAGHVLVEECPEVVGPLLDEHPAGN